LIGCMVEQSLPEGQHIADLPSLKATHVEVDGQQKLPGRPFLLQGVYPDIGHVSSALPVSSALSNRFIISTARWAADAAVMTGTMVEIRHAAVSLTKADRTIVEVLTRIS